MDQRHVNCLAILPVGRRTIETKQLSRKVLRRGNFLRARLVRRKIVARTAIVISARARS